MKILERQSQSVFTWQQTSRNNYQILCGSDVFGSLALSLERSILIAPGSGDFYRAHAQIGGHTYSFKCIFLDGRFRGCLLTEEGEDQPLAFF